MNKVFEIWSLIMCRILNAVAMAATGSVSLFGTYEYPMPENLIDKKDMGD